MKRCQVGTRNYNEANDLHAACYGTIGRLLHEREQLMAVTAKFMCGGANGCKHSWDGEVIVKTTECPCCGKAKSIGFAGNVLLAP